MADVLQEIAHHFQTPFESPVLIFSLILFIILLAPILLKKIRIPGVIGLIISGIVIGPDGLNLIQVDQIEIFSTIGLLYIMFIAGLELDLNQFKANKNKSLVFGFFTFFIPLAVGFPVCYYFLSIFDPHFTIESAFLTASMFATHTLVTYPIVSKLGVSKNTAVAVTVGATMLTDTAVLILLAVILGSHNGGLTQEFWIQLLISITLFSAFMFFVIPKIARWFFEKFAREKHSHYIFVLAVVFLAAFLAEIAGLEAIIGAFFAGLALNKLIPSSSALMNRVEFIGNSLFIPFFLIGVGMIVDLEVIMSGWVALIIAGTLTVVAIFGKWLAAFITQKVFKFSKGQRNIIFGLSSSHAAATLAVIMVGHEAGILDDNILNGTVVLILITCIISSFVTEKGAKAVIRDSKEEVELDPEAADEFILIPIANTVNLEKMLSFAVFVKDKRSRNPLSILTVVPNNNEAEKKIVKARQGIENFVTEAKASDTAVDVRATIDHNAASGIARTAREVSANMVFLGWPQQAGFINKLIGDKMDSIISVTQKTLFICDFAIPLINHTRIYLVIPPNAEFEEGFSTWLTKIAQLSVELSIPIALNCTEKTHKAITRYAEKRKLSLAMTFNKFQGWDNFFSLSSNFKETDLVVLVSARSGYVSHFHHLDRLPGKLEDRFPEMGKIVVYPE